MKQHLFSILFLFGVITSFAAPLDTIIVDDKDVNQVSFTGSTSNSSNGGSYLGSSTKLETVGGTAFFRPDTARTGNYNVYVWNRSGGWVSNAKHYFTSGPDTFRYK